MSLRATVPQAALRIPAPASRPFGMTILRASARRQGLSPLSTGNEERRPPRVGETTLPVVNGGNPRVSRTPLPILGWLVARSGIVAAAPQVTANEGAPQAAHIQKGRGGTPSPVAVKDETG